MSLRKERLPQDTPLTFRTTASLVAVYAVAMTGMALWAPAQQFVWLYSEAGPFEILSGGFWLLLAVLLFALPGVPRRELVVPGLVALLAAAREADLHKAFTTESIFKSHFYLKSAAPPAEKLAGGLVALAALALLLGVAWSGLRRLRAAGARWPEWLRTALLGVALVVLCKIADRSESVLGDWTGYVYSEQLWRFNAAFEEGFECLLPVLFIVSLLQYQARSLRQLHRQMRLLAADPLGLQQLPVSREAARIPAA